MGYTSACAEGNVGIGTASPNSRLFVGNSPTTTSVTSNVRTNIVAGESLIGQIGFRSSTVGGRVYNIAIEGTARANFNASETSGNEPTIGVRGIATIPFDSFNTTCGYTAIGVYGEASGHPGCNGVLAGYFAGNVVVGQPAINLSDSEIKDNITELEGSLESIMRLSPKSYTIREDIIPSVDTQRLNFGLIAQEVEEVFPDMVAEVPAPFKSDEEGNLLPSDQMYKGVRYTELIPVLIGAVQEQQELIEGQQSQIDALGAALAACCEAAPEQRSGSMEDDIRLESVPSLHKMDQNAPNPFTDYTSLQFDMGSDAHARVCIYSSNGQLIDCLVDEMKNQGKHRVNWDTSNLAPGIYFFSLEVDGFEQVRRAVKL